MPTPGKRKKVDLTGPTWEESSSCMVKGGFLCPISATLKVVLGVKFCYEDVFERHFFLLNRW